MPVVRYGEDEGPMFEVDYKLCVQSAESMHAMSEERPVKK